MKVLVVDSGLYIELALTLARSGLFERVGYCNPTGIEDFPYPKEASIGQGFEEIVVESERPYDAMVSYDGFVFPDNGYGDLQDLLRGVLGKRVWGSGRFEELELNRELLRAHMTRLHMPSPQTRVVNGVQDLLEDHRIEPGDFIKISKWRGLMETHKYDGGPSPDYLWDLAKGLGPWADSFPIQIEKPLKGVELGFDGIVVGGKLLYPCLLGIEKKDAGYLGCVVNQLPPAQSRVAAGIEAMIDSSYNNFLSTECRKGVLLDLTTRAPQPPSHGMLNVFDMGGIIKDVLNGDTPDVETRGTWLQMLILKRSDNERYQKVEVDEEYADMVKFSRVFKYEGELWIAPGQAHEVGTVSGIGATPEEAQRECKKALEAVHADDLVTTGALDAFEELNKEWEKAADEGDI